jgi:hypothetical protein
MNGSKALITASEADIDTAEELMQLQLQLSIWQLHWDEVCRDSAQPQQVAGISGKCRTIRFIRLSQSGATLLL